MKKIIISLIMVVLLTCSQSFTYAADASTANDNWIQDAFSATDTFLKEKDVKDTIGITKPFYLFKNFIRGLNRTLIVALSGLSIIALSITGIRYILGGNNADQQTIAKKSLKTIFIGMAIGFGAFTIWKIAISIVDIVMGTFGSS